MSRTAPMMFAIHNTCELSTRQTAMLTGLFHLFSLDLLLEILWMRWVDLRPHREYPLFCTQALWIFAKCESNPTGIAVRLDSDQRMA